MRVATRRDAFLPTLGGLIGIAWFALWVWAQSPYGRYLDHGNWTEIGLAASICRAIPAGEVVVPALIYIGGWVLMSAAMMLPTTFPLLTIFRRMTLGRLDQGMLTALLILGYLVMWTAFGIVAHLLDYALHEVAAGSAWLAVNGWVLGACVLASAGIFQFSSLKYHCLDKCRTPLSFVIEHWRGERERWQTFVLGLHHGAFCVGCCWALMLLMFVVGTGSVGWMLILGAVMAMEKNLPWGHRLSTPLGIALLIWSVLIVYTEAGIWWD